MKIEDIKLVTANLKRPIRYDKEGQWFTDREFNRIADMRGWGWIQYKNNPEHLQDSIAEFICMVINSYELPYQPDEDGIEFLLLKDSQK